ncbi:hypothetical protein QCD71_12350 [Sphingomonas sp. PsM26]|nr:hypothetical protein [Sphingomonas sp. PsM26]
MIEFIQDYTTKALPPEVFKTKDQVKRSPESELYFVRLGVAGFVHNGELVGEDYKPLVRVETVVQVVSPGDRRFADGGRGGEMLGLATPQRASTGPGNDVVFGTSDVSTGLQQVQVDQLSSDLAASMQQLDEHRDLTSGQITELTTALTAVQGERETALADLASVTSDRDAAITERDEHRKSADEAGRQLQIALNQMDGLNADNERLKTALAEAATSSHDASDDAPTPKRGK